MTSLHNALDLISKLACHLATELDLHYDDLNEDHLEDEFRQIEIAKAFLIAGEHPVPDVVDHILSRRADNRIYTPGASDLKH
ncbi:hypothetical protein [Salipiger sp.]|uniref:hypothetical protein n=1 Tax=Salipiger sp. TaxID=2078585 RepID=UPI003A97496C